MDNKDNMTIEQLERLAQAYFDCELNRREEEELKAVLLFAEAHSALIDECRLAMGLESIAAHPQTSASTVRHRFKFYKWIAVAACLAAIAATGFFMLTTGEQLQNSSETIITVYANGKRLTDIDRAQDIAMSRYNECIALAKKLEYEADMRLKRADKLQQSNSEIYLQAMRVQTQSEATEASIINRINKYTTSTN